MLHVSCLSVTVLTEVPSITSASHDYYCKNEQASGVQSRPEAVDVLPPRSLGNLNLFALLLAKILKVLGHLAIHTIGIHAP